MSNQDKERADFESWYRSKYGAIGSYEKWKSTEVVYMFVAWQASAARYTARIVELEAVVAQLKWQRDCRSKFIKETVEPWLLEASEKINDWGQYAPAYFQDKHSLNADVETFESRAGRCIEIVDTWDARDKPEAMKGGA